MDAPGREEVAFHLVSLRAKAVPVARTEHSTYNSRGRLLMRFGELVESSSPERTDRRMSFRGRGR
jgi:hypothetical protein